MNVLTAEDISIIQSDILYRDVLPLLKYGEFKTIQKIGKNRIVISQDEFLKYAERNGIKVDLSKLNKQKEPV